MQELDLFERLASTRLALEETSDSRERDRLMTRLHELRAEVGQRTLHGMATITDRQVARRIGDLERRLRELNEQRSRMSGCGSEVLRAMSHNTAVDARGGRDAIEAELLALRAEQANRSHPDCTGC